MDFYSIIETARKTGKIEKGTNEVTKAIERGTAKFVAYAADVEPKEIVQHLPVLCKDKNIKCEEVDSKQKLGIAVGLPVSCSAIAIIEAGDAEKNLKALKTSEKAKELVKPKTTKAPEKTEKKSLEKPSLNETKTEKKSTEKKPVEKAEEKTEK